MSYALTRMPADYRLLVTVQDPAGGAAVHVVVADVALPLFQPLPGGRLLLVGARARWSETGGGVYSLAVASTPWLSAALEHHHSIGPSAPAGPCVNLSHSPIGP